jgi:hypothetical protein
MLTYIVPLYLDAVNTRDAGQLSQRVEQVTAIRSQQVEPAQGAAQPVQASVHTQQRRPAVDHTSRTSVCINLYSCCMPATQCITSISC